jgi:hypothetical protein
MPVTQSNNFPDGLTPVCASCNVFMCWDISKEEYQEAKEFWDSWRCKDCNPNYRGALKEQTLMDKESKLDVIEMMLKKSSEERPVTSYNLGTLIGEHWSNTNPQARKLVRELIERRGIPVGSNAQGYFIMKDTKQLQESLNRLMQRQASISHRIHSMYTAFNTYNK